MKKLLVLAVLLCATSAFARPIRSWTYDELLKEADVAAIIRVDRVEDVAATLDGHGDTKQYQGKRATAIVGLSLKGAPPQTFSIDFFTYSSTSGIRVNGALFPDLSKADNVHYLVFLKKTPNGTFIPVGGHYDGARAVQTIQANGLITIPEFKVDQRPAHDIVPAK